MALRVEWLAKPRLEARKDRILARSRAEFEMRRQLIRIRESSVRLFDYPSLKGASNDQQAWARKTYDEFAERIRSAIGVFDEAMTDIAPELPSELYSLFTAYVALVVGILVLPGAEDPHLGGVHDADEEPGISGGVVGKVPVNVGEVPDSRQIFGGDCCLRAGESRERRRRLSRPGPWSAAGRGPAR